MQRGSNYKDQDGAAQLVPDGETVSWDTKGLEALIVQDPEAYGWLSKYRKGYVRVE